MPLTHVLIWSEDGWKDITIEKAEKMHPGGKVSASSGLFMCRLCGQYVILTKDEGINKRHFRHSKAEASKDCPDRSELSENVPKINAFEVSLPIKLEVISSSSFNLSIGLFFPPSIKKSGTIEIETIPVGNSKFKFNFSRLKHDKLTYLSLGETPAKQFRIKTFDVNKEKIQIFPDIIDVINPGGTLFDASYMKKLPNGADVVSGHKYFLLTTKNFISHPYESIDISIVCTSENWKIYEVIANNFNEEAAKFFLDYHCILTENPVSVNMIWPVHINSPYVIHYHGDKIYTYIQGEYIHAILFPTDECKSFFCDNKQGRVVSIPCNERQQLLSTGRTKVLRYTYLWKTQLDKEASIPEISVTTLMGKEVSSGISYNLPESKTLLIQSQFDGYVEIKKDGWLIEKRKLKADVLTEIDMLQYGMNIRIFQGLDCIWSVSYERNNYIDDIDEQKLLKQLKCAGGSLFPIAHSFGAVARKYKGYPLVQKWIYARIRAGYISEKAYKIIRRK